MMEKSLNNNEKTENFDCNFKEIKQKIETVCQQNEIDVNEIILLAATKTVPVEVINHAIESGIKYVGENKVQEFLSKNEFLNSDVKKHFIGHLQTNKVKSIVPFVEMIESVSSLKLAKEIGKCASEIGTTMPILLEVNIGNEESKSGFTIDEITENIEEIAKIKGISVLGLMTIPPICENNDELAKYFSKMRQLFIDIGHKKIDNVSMLYLSMGMSSDYELAIKFGANIVRIGSSLFGQRNYCN